VITIAIATLVFVVYFCVAVFTAYRSWRGFWLNFSIVLLMLLGLVASHTNHNTPADGLVEWFLAALFATLFVLTGLAWLCSWGSRYWRKA
jgi:phosphoglycerol transferase MdoB-like AlkP superfamily enzyme